MTDRVQLRRTKGWKMPDNTVKVDHSTKWGNPFPITKGVRHEQTGQTPVWQIGTWHGPAMWIANTDAEAREISVNAFRAWLSQPAQANLVVAAKSALRGKNIGCWCREGVPCHGDVWLELANAVGAA